MLIPACTTRKTEQKNCKQKIKHFCLTEISLQNENCSSSECIACKSIFYEAISKRRKSRGLIDKSISQSANDIPSKQFESFSLPHFSNETRDKTYDQMRFVCKIIFMQIK